MISSGAFRRALCDDLGKGTCVVAGLDAGDECAMKMCEIPGTVGGLAVSRRRDVKRKWRTGTNWDGNANPWLGLYMVLEMR